MGSKTLFNAVFIRPEQVVRFLLCKRDSNNGSGESADIEGDQNMSSDEDESAVRLGNVDW